MVAGRSAPTPNVRRGRDGLCGSQVLSVKQTKMRCLRKMRVRILKKSKSVKLAAMWMLCVVVLMMRLRGQCKLGFESHTDRLSNVGISLLSWGYHAPQKFTIVCRIHCQSLCVRACVRACVGVS